MRSRSLFVVAALALGTGSAGAQGGRDAYATIDQMISKTDQMSSQLEACLAQRAKARAAVKNVDKKPAPLNFTMAPFVPPDAKPPSGNKIPPPPAAPKPGPVPAVPPPSGRAHSITCVQSLKGMVKPGDDKAVLAARIKGNKSLDLGGLEYWVRCSAFLSYDISTCDLLLKLPDPDPNAKTPYTTEKGAVKDTKVPSAEEQRGRGKWLASRCREEVTAAWDNKPGSNPNFNWHPSPECAGIKNADAAQACEKGVQAKEEARKKKEAADAAAAAAKTTKAAADAAAAAAKTKAAMQALEAKQKAEYESRRRATAEIYKHQSGDMSAQVKVMSQYNDIDKACVGLVQNMRQGVNTIFTLLQGFEPKTAPGLSQRRDEAEALQDKVNRYVNRTLPCTGKETPGDTLCKEE